MLRGDNNPLKLPRSTDVVLIVFFVGWTNNFEKIKEMKRQEKKYYFDAGIKYWDIFYQERGEEKCEWFEAYDGFVYAYNKAMALEYAKIEARKMLIHDMGINTDETLMEIEIAQLYETIEEACL